MPETDVERVNMNWPPGLKDQVRERVGARGVTGFAVEAIQYRLSDEDRVLGLQAEVDELRYLVQLLADRYVMGGDHENRESFLMELTLPSWVKTEGWPADLAKQVPKMDPVPQSVNTSNPASGHVERAEQELDKVDEFSDEELSKPSYAVAAETKSDPEPEVQNAAPTPQDEGNDFFSRVQSKAAEKGIDISGAGLKPASKIDSPEKHNHAWQRDESKILVCECGSWIDEKAGPNGTVRDASWPKPKLPTRSAPTLEVPTEEPTPVAAAAARSLDDFDVDF